MSDVPEDRPATRAWDDGNSEWYTDDLRDAADAMRDELLEALEQVRYAYFAADKQVRRERERAEKAEAALAQARAQLDAVFHEFTDEMEADAWEATLEWLRRDYPDLAARYEHEKGDRDGSP